MHGGIGMAPATAYSISSRVCRFRALSLSGRLMVTMAMEPWTS
ncbi:MAG: hypothetical protein ACKO55_01915 [Bacteroidota bacterium]